MQAYRFETVIREDGVLTLTNLPLQAGSNIEVMIMVRSAPPRGRNRYPLRGEPVTYLQPTEPVALSDWDVIL